MSIPESPFAWSPWQRRRYVDEQITQYNWETRSGADILRELRERGIGIRESDFYAIRRKHLEPLRFERDIAALDDDELIPLAWTQPSPGWELSGDFQYRVRVWGTDLAGENEIFTFMALSSDEQLSKRQVIERLGSIITADQSFYGLQVDAISVYQVYRR